MVYWNRYVGVLLKNYFLNFLTLLENNFVKNLNIFKNIQNKNKIFIYFKKLPHIKILILIKPYIRIKKKTNISGNSTISDGLG